MSLTLTKYVKKEKEKKIEGEDHATMLSTWIATTWIKKKRMNRFESSLGSHATFVLFCHRIAQILVICGSSNKFL